MIQIKRAYEAPGKNDGSRFLVERLWPRGVKKENLQMQDWLKDVAPTSELRQWFQHDPAKGGEFRAISGNWRNILLHGSRFSRGLSGAG
jgi:uncharacterized protein YeaO (DUF488 family)